MTSIVKQFVYVDLVYKLSIAACMLGVYTLFDQSLFTTSFYGFDRARALFTEPSAYGPVVSVVFYISLYLKNYLVSLISLLSLYAAQSGTVFVVFVLVGLVLSIKLLQGNRKKILLLFSMLFLFFFTAHYLMNLDIFTNSFNFVRFADVLSKLENNEYESLSRVGTLLDFYNILIMENSLIMGLGWNTEKAYLLNTTGIAGNFSFSIIHSVLFGFGLTGVMLLFVLIVYSLRLVLLNGNYESLVIYLSFIFASLVNSSGGYVLYKIPIILIFIILAKSKYISREKT